MTETLTPVTAHFALTSNNLDLALKAAAHPSIAHAISPKNFDPWSFPEVVLHKLAANPVCPRETLRLIATRKSPSLIAAILDHPK